MKPISLGRVPPPAGGGVEVGGVKEAGVAGGVVGGEWIGEGFVSEAREGGAGEEEGGSEGPLVLGGVGHETCECWKDEPAERSGTGRCVWAFRHPLA